MDVIDPASMRPGGQLLLSNYEVNLLFKVTLDRVSGLVMTLQLATAPYSSNRSPFTNKLIT